MISDRRVKLGTLQLRYAGIFLYAPRDDPQRTVRQRPLQPQGLVRRRRHPGLDLFRRREDDRHRLRVDGTDLGVRLRRQKRVEVVGGLAFLDLPDRRPAGPDAGEAGRQLAGRSVIPRVEHIKNKRVESRR
jgi:hypothetical protein